MKTATVMRTVEIAEDILDSARLSIDDIKTELAVSLYAQKRLSIGKARELAGMSLSERAQLPCIGPERADLVVAGCAILEGILDIWPAARLGVADRGIREGILRRLMETGA